MTVTSKVRLYDLAKELKQDTKRLIEEVRREGVDVSVPSNSISKELADKIRNRYFPKKEASAPRKVVIVKKARPVAEEAPSAEEAGGAIEAPAEVDSPAESPAPTETHGAPPPAVVVRQVRKLSPAVRAEHPGSVGAGTSPAPEADEPSPEAQQPTSHAPAEMAQPAEEAVAPVVAPPAAEPSPEAQPAAAASAPPAAQPQPQQPAQPPAPSRQVRVLRPTAAALNAGVRHGERAPAPTPPPPPPVSPRERRERQERGGERGGAFARARGPHGRTRRDSRRDRDAANHLHPLAF